MTLYHVYDKRDQLVSFVCGACVRRHLRRREARDMLIIYNNSKEGECPDSLHDEGKLNADYY